jgi:chemotaxis protein MotB
MGKKVKDDDDGGGDDWLTTFADMATLLMAFFVLILSFAELDVIKYKAIVGSMKQALGVEKKEMEFLKSPTEKKDATKRDTPTTTSGNRSIDAMRQQQVTTQARLVREKLSELVQESLVAVEERAQELIIRIPEKGVFPSGSARLAKSFEPVLLRIRDALAQAEGEIIVSGHTDSRPINNPDYRSNWDLSAERAVSVVHVLLVGDVLDPERVTAQGFADTRPLVPDADSRSMQLNRRVEILVQRPKPKPEQVERSIEDIAGKELPDNDDTGEPKKAGDATTASDGEGADDGGVSTPEPDAATDDAADKTDEGAGDAPAVPDKPDTATVPDKPDTATVPDKPDTATPSKPDIAPPSGDKSKDEGDQPVKKPESDDTGKPGGDSSE